MPLFADDFTDLLFLSNDELVDLLNKVDNVTLLVASAKCDPNVLLRIRTVLSQTGREYFDDDLKNIDPIYYSQSSEAQQSVVDILNTMIENNEIQWIKKQSVC